MEQQVSLSDAEFDYIFAHFKPLSFKKKEQLIQIGDIVENEYFVLSGCLSTYVVNDAQKMHILQFAMTTWWASDYQALYKNERATVNVNCVSDAEVLCLADKDREKICTELHHVERFFRWRSNGGYVSLQKRILSLLNDDAQSRYEELMYQYPALYNLVPKHLIAAYLGVSRETLSRFQRV
ncbi:Crp/Fnr family transcriptional regulator [Sphingobacterium oryzagri]|uniref:Crp/Fnr family transcriptional regulator n=1 Tax=Sphingobacterium oryzagri TaxID=3025669 RepID=A0ABY7WPN6_9SPHI|nr:Crp/Fnr family transcriptional regulator [Sphingobacterium sp. KACC 22765]WDF70378.1 Crp/Fnr family transcriptional regulator [Sphingobacterium sp. KACC 22765]